MKPFCRKSFAVVLLLISLWNMEMTQTLEELIIQAHGMSPL